MDQMKDGFSILYGIKQKIASTVSLSSDASHKVIIIDETITPPTGAALLRAILRRFMATVGLSSPATSKTKSSNHFIPVALWLNSELGESKNAIAAGFFARLQEILGAEGIEFDNKVLVELINKHFPDCGGVLNECQRYSVGGKIDSAILAEFGDVKVNDLIRNLRRRISKRPVSGSLIIWTMILVYFCAVFMMLFYILKVLLLLLPCSLLLSISIRSRS